MTTVTHEIDGKVGVVTLAKPPHNLLDDQLINDLVAAYQAVVEGDAARSCCAAACGISAPAPRWLRGEQVQRSTPASSSSKRC